MKTTAFLPANPFFGRAAFGLLAATVLALSPGYAGAALTDISNSPIAGTTSAQTKPNIMLLMDASGSMGWTHMPDEVEGPFAYNGQDRIGYKSAQCNVLYYNPLTTYELPRMPNGAPFPAPIFNAARYAGYVAYYATPDPTDSSSVSLGSQFRAYDAKTLKKTTAVPPDTAQPAYYYVYTGPQALNYATAPCNQMDTGATVAATGGGTWTRKIVGSSSGPGGVDERQNFAIWYQYYRTRISLIKSAASLAFAPLTDSFRVGFITVEPKSTPNAAAINPDRYVAIDDFTPTQRNTWFQKLFSQSPSGASPAREGLARVGRHYAGKQDGINNGMTGDPVQFSCQQNFTIMTTDGYWNSQTESPGGGPLRIDGVTRVGQQDGTLTTNAGNSPRPIWEGFASDTTVETNKTNQFNYVPCGTYQYVSTSQVSASTVQNTTTTAQTTQSTSQVNLSTTQQSASTSQTTRSTLQRTSHTEQITSSTLQQSRSTSQVTQSSTQLQRIDTQLQTRTEQTSESTSQQLRSTTQDTQSTSQLTQSTLQTRVQTARVDASTTQITRSTSQLQQTTSQINVSTTQQNRSTSQQLATTSQTSRSTSQLNSCDAQTETCTPVAAGSCTPGGYITCETVTTGPTLVASCTNASANAGNAYTATTCSTTTSAATPVATCTAAGANSGNGYTTTTCSTATAGPTPVASCSPSGPNAGNSYTTTSCGTTSTGPSPAASCTPSPATSGNAYTATTCATTTTGPTGVNSCSAAPATSGNAYTSTSCNTATTGPTGVSSCSPQSAASGNSWTAATCNTVNTGPTPVSSCTAASGAAGNSWVTTSCTPVNSGPTPAAACSPSGGNAGNNWTTTTCPNVATPATGVASCTPQAANAGNAYTATICATPTTGPTGVAPATCVASPANAGNNYVATTCNTVATGPTPVASCAPSGPTSGNGWVTTTCGSNNTGPTLVTSCTPIAAGAGNGYTATTCSTSSSPWVNTGSCNAAAANAGNGYTATYCQTIILATTNVASCTPAPPGPTGAGVSCNNNTVGATPVASCTPQTGSALNGWQTITCATVTSGPTLVASCTPSAASAGNFYTDTTCSNATTGPTPAASCTPSAPNAGNSFTATLCNTTSSPTVPVASCTPDPAGAGNSYTATVCADVVTGPTPVSSCTASAAASGNSWTETTCNTATSGPTTTASCAAQTANAGNGWIDVTCSSVTTGPTPVNACTPAAPTGGNNYVATTCATATTGPTGVVSCTPVVASAGNGWTTTSCNSVNNTVGSATCTPDLPNAGNGYTTTTCSTLTTGPTPVTSCTNAAPGSGNGYVGTTCTTSNTGPTVTASCTPQAANAGNSFTTTSCSTAAGRLIQYATTTTVTTTQLSGGIVIGTPTVTTATSAASNLDGVCYAAGTEPALPTPNPQRAGLAAGPNPPAGCGAWPCTVATANSGGSIDSLADVAQYYYVTDLRPGMTDNVPAVGGGPEDDRVSWQHMTTFVVGLGVSGTLEYKPNYRSSATITGDFAHIRTGSIPVGDTSGTGAINWPVWPDPALNYNGFAGGNFALWDNPKSIDDFWHTAVNGRGRYFSAGNPQSVVAGLSAALAGVATRVGSGTGVAVSNFTPVPGDNFAYSPSYVTSSWVGDVKASEIDTTTGVVATTPIWSAQALLNAKTSGLCDNRNIYLLRQGATDNKVNFTWNTRTCDSSGNPTGAADTGLNATEMLNFGAAKVVLFSQYLAMTDGTFGTVDQRSAAPGEKLVNFLRGQRGYEGFLPNDADKLYRTRDHVLGDIVGGQPVYVKAPFATYQDAGYSAFKAANASRTPMVYVPANDGMLHAFFAGTSNLDPQGGKEAWAIIPSAILPNLYKLADDNYKNNHQFFVDATPTVNDAYDGSAWKTILVGGLGAGGRSYYALDVTDPLAPKALWEFKADSNPLNCPLLASMAAGNTADCHLGLTFGKPIISKLVNGTWVVMFTSGYNNVNVPSSTGDGVGYLYVLNAFSGQILYKIPTAAGSLLSPSGLTHITNFVDASLLNNTTKQVYGGDLQGNIWRFDVNNTIAPAGREATLIGVATDPGGTPQPITTRPELAELNSKPMVFVGTGRLLGATDFTDAQVQSVYGIVDPLTGSPAYANLRGALKPLAITQSGTIRTVACTGSSAQCGTSNGWVVDLPESGERVNVDMKLARGTLVFGSNVPQSSACVVGGHSWLNYLNFSTGLAVSSSPGLSVSALSTDSLTVGLSVIQIQGQLVGVRRFADASNGGGQVPSAGPPFGGKRISWREIAQ